MRHDADRDARQAMEISQILHEQARSSAGILWLAIDAPGDAAGCLAGDLEDAFEGRTATVLPLSHPSVDPAWRPRWLRLDTSTPSGSLLLQESIAQALVEIEPDRLRSGQGRRIAGWLQLGAAEPSTATAHVAREMIRRGPTGTQRLVRLHDPAVLWALWPLLGSAQQRKLLGPLNSWTILDPRGGIACLRGAGDGTADAWSAALWQDVDAITPLNAALRSVDLCNSIETAADLERARVVVLHAFRRARNLGFSHSRDLAAFALHAVKVHPAFDSHPLVATALRGRSADDHYMELVDSLSNEDWVEIGQSMRAA